MRFHELEIGGEYTLLRGPKPRRVTVLKTPADVRGRGKVRVRSEDGVTQGRVVDQQLRFIVSRWGESPDRSNPRRRRKPATEPGPWPPVPGDRVRWPAETAGIEWTVTRVDHQDRTANLVGKLFSREQEHTAPLAELEPLPVAIRRVDNELPAADVPVAEYVPPSASGEEDRRSPLERAVDRLEFSERCLRQYRKEFAPRVPWPKIAERLRRELKNQGETLRRDREYLRIRTRRFDVRVMTAPSDMEPYWVEELLPLPRRRKRSRRAPKAPRKPSRRAGPSD